MLLKKTGLMRLDSLHIKNYKLFKDLEIPKLGQVNLITGKNNTGKTILLEALRIWANRGYRIINNIVWKRGDWNPKSQTETYVSLFYDKKPNRIIEIGNLIITSVLSGDFREIKSLTAEWRDKSNQIVPSSSTTIQMEFGDKEDMDDEAIYIPASTEFDNYYLWKNILIDRKKYNVIEIMKVIEPSIIELEVIEGKAFVGLEGVPNLVPLKNFGEGSKRLLTIAMALVSAEDNLLLIDEVDTGLHYSVLEKLWGIIFEFSEQLNTQVFVTTHSGDCVDAFSTVANQERFKGLGNYFRLSRKEEGVVAVEYDIDELEMALESNIETR